MLGSVAIARQPMCGIDGNRVPPRSLLENLSGVMSPTKLCDWCIPIRLLINELARIEYARCEWAE